jgi:hypothetical protein
MCEEDCESVAPCLESLRGEPCPVVHLAEDPRARLMHHWTHPDRLGANGVLVYDASLSGPTYRAFLDTWPGN